MRRLLDENFIETVSERDIDLVVLEELAVNDAFREWLASRALGEPTVTYCTEYGWTVAPVLGKNMGQLRIVNSSVAH
jgi:hypothetical protein